MFAAGATQGDGGAKKTSNVRRLGLLGPPGARLWRPKGPVAGLRAGAGGPRRQQDRSGDWLYGTLYKFGFCNSPESRSRDDGLSLTDAYVTAAVRCAPPANKPLPQERSNCLPYLLREFELLSNVQVVVALGRFAFDAYLALRASQGDKPISPRPRFGHGETYPLPGGVTLICSYHPSQHNTLTGRLTQNMFDAVFRKAKQLLDGG